MKQEMVPQQEKSLKREPLSDAKQVSSRHQESMGRLIDGSV